MNSEDIRWKQRFQNFEKALHYLEHALSIENPDIVYKAGIIQFFEMSFELAWNVLKDYLEEQGFLEVKSPKSSLKKAFEIGIIDNGHIWMELLQDRNLTAHTYDEKKIIEVELLIHKKYFPLLKELYEYFKIKSSE